MLQQVLEIHVISTILQRSLILDEESLSRVGRYLRQDYPPQSAARLAQRQIKVALHELQRSHISKVLQDWGGEMWNGNKNTAIEKRWAVMFSVFVTLALVMYVLNSQLPVVAACFDSLVINDTDVEVMQ